MITLDATDKHHGNKMTNETLPASSIDQIIAWLGRIICWCGPARALLVRIMVLLRYGFNTGAIAAQESGQYLHATGFMLGAAVTLGADQHVRVDIFYRSFSERQKAWVNILGHIVLTLPVCALIGWGALDYVLDSWSAREASPEPGGLPFIFLLKTLIPMMAVLFALQSLAQCRRALSTLQRGSTS